MKHFMLTGFADEISADFEQQLQVLKKLGLDFIEIRGVDKQGIDQYPAAAVRELKKRLDNQGIGISALASPIGKMDICREFAPHLEHFKHVAELAHILETPYIRIFSFFIPRGAAAGDFRSQVFERMGALVDYAADEAVVLLHENEKDIYGDSISRCRKLMDAFYGQHFKAAFDFANFIQCGQDCLEAFEVLRPFIEYVHIKDACAVSGRIVPAGKGDGRIAEILGRLKAGGYHGFLSLEPHLTEFEGLRSLEMEGDSLQGMEQMDGAAAFTMAWDALQQLLTMLPG